MLFTGSGFPACNFGRASKIMLATMLKTVFFTYIIVSVFIRFAGRRSAPSLCAGLRVLAGFVIFAELVGTTIIIRRHRIDADAVAFDKPG